MLGGIPSDDRSSFPAGTARRKGLTFTMVRRMNATYPRAIELASSAIDLDLLVTDHYPLTEAAEGLRHGRRAARRQGGHPRLDVVTGYFNRTIRVVELSSSSTTSDRDRRKSLKDRKPSDFSLNDGSIRFI